MIYLAWPFRFDPLGDLLTICSNADDSSSLLIYPRLLLQYKYEDNTKNIKTVVRANAAR